MIQTIYFPWPDKALSPNARVHWAKRAKAVKAYRNACRTITMQSGIQIDWEGIAHLWMTFYPPDKRHRDDDNLIASFKSGRDGMAEAIGIDDKRFRLHPFVSDVTKPGGTVEVTITQGGDLKNGR